MRYGGNRSRCFGRLPKCVSRFRLGDRSLDSIRLAPRFARDDRVEVSSTFVRSGEGNMAVTFESVRRMALALEKVEEGTSYGRRRSRWAAR